MNTKNQSVRDRKLVEWARLVISVEIIFRFLNLQQNCRTFLFLEIRA